MKKENTLIKRDRYFAKIEPFIGTNIIKVLTGQRRVGKSYLMRQLINEVSEKSPDTKVMYIDKEKIEFDFIRNYVDLMDYITLEKGEKTALFIDEIQEIDEFERAIRSIYDDPSFDIFITGSNANLLSGELATYLSGRYHQIEVHPLSYAEFLRFHKKENNDETFEQYLKVGGMPNLIHINLEEEIVMDYLRNIYSTILLKDVIKRNNIRNVSFLENLVLYLADNVGSLVSAKKISDFLKSQRQSISPNTVLDYIGFLEKTYFISNVKREEIQGKKIFEISEKFYFEDIGLRNSVIGFRPNDIAKLLENLVYNHLKMAGYKVTVGVDGVNEIDFIAKKSGETIYVQVCYVLQDQKTIEREFGNLLRIKDQYPKYVVSMDKIIGKNTYQGIIHKSIRDFIFELE
jgi:uncharacterized protein